MNNVAGFLVSLYLGILSIFGINQVNPAMTAAAAAPITTAFATQTQPAPPPTQFPIASSSPTSSSSSAPDKTSPPTVLPIIQQTIVEQGSSNAPEITALSNRLNSLISITGNLAALLPSLSLQSNQQSNQASTPQWVAGNGNPDAIGMEAPIDQLSNTSIFNPTITGGSITASSISGTIGNAIDAVLGTIDALTSNTITTTNATTTTLYTSGTSTLAQLSLPNDNCNSYGNGGKLTTDAFGNVICAADQGGAGSTVGGSVTQVQFNNNGSFAASPNFTFSSSTNTLSATNASFTAATSSSLFAMVASSTSLYAQTGSLGSLALGTPLLTSSGGTGIANPWATGILLGSYAGGGYQQLATSSLGLLTTNVAEGSNLYFTAARVASILAGTTTDALTQGLTNKYFSNALAQSAISISGTPLTYSNGLIGINQASASQAGYLGSTDWTSFNNKISSSSLSATYPLAYNGIGNFSISFGTTTSNTWAGTQTFTNTITGSVSGNANTAATLQTPRTINGVSFNGSANIIVASTTLLTDKNTFSGANMFLASTTIGNGTTGLTVSGNATTTGNSYFTGGLGVGLLNTAAGTLQTSGNATVGGTLAINGNQLTLFQSAVSPLEFQVTNTLSASYPRTIFSGGDSTSDSNWIMRFADAYSGISDNIPVGIQLSTNNVSNYTNSDTFMEYMTDSNAQIVTINGVAEDGKPIILSTQGSAAGGSPNPGIFIDTVANNENIGIGTATPYSRLEVFGPNTASTSAFAVVNSASTTEFTVYDTGNAILAGSLVQNSDQRLKTNIQSLDASSSLSLINQLNPVTFNWIDPEKSSVPQLGFIAQQVRRVFPNLISTTSPTALTPDGTLSLNYIDLISPIISAIQALDQQLTSLESTIADFAENFNSKQITATNELCIGHTCINEAQLQNLLAAAAAPSTNSSKSLSSTNTSTDTPDSMDSASSPQAPVIQINGANPAIIQVGMTYNDLGATITDPQADLNLGIATYLNDVPMSSLLIDTTAAATDTIDYVVTDQNGLTSTSTRTVIIEASVSNVDANATTTDTTATSSDSQ